MKNPTSTHTFRIAAALGLLLGSVTPSLHAEENQDRKTSAIIEKARKFLGGNEKLEQIHTLKYVGTINSPERERAGSLVMELKKPLKQRIEIETPSGDVEVTAVNGYEGWILKQSAGEEAAEIRVMTPDNLNRMLVSTWENLNFFKEPTEQHAKSIYQGVTEYRGRTVHELHVIYPGGTPTFKRFFDVQTGDLMGSLTDDGLEFIESGMILVDGLQFPRKIEAYRGEKRVHVIEFDEVIVNPSLADDRFEYPTSIPVKRKIPSMNDYRK